MYTENNYYLLDSKKNLIWKKKNDLSPPEEFFNFYRKIRELAIFMGERNPNSQLDSLELKVAHQGEILLVSCSRFLVAISVKNPELYSVYRVKPISLIKVFGHNSDKVLSVTLNNSIQVHSLDFKEEEN